MCNFKFPLNLKQDGHWGQLKWLSLEWTCNTCNFMFPIVLKLYEHRQQLKGLSSGWTVIVWRKKTDLPFSTKIALITAKLITAKQSTWFFGIRVLSICISQKDSFIFGSGVFFTCSCTKRLVTVDIFLFHKAAVGNITHITRSFYIGYLQFTFFRSIFRGACTDFSGFNIGLLINFLLFMYTLVSRYKLELGCETSKK